MRLFFPKGDAVGQPLIIRAQTWQVIGVIADVVDRRLDTPRGAFGYVPSAFNPGSISVVMRTRLDPSSLAAAAAAEVARLDPGVALANPRSLEQAMADSLTERRVMLALVGVFATAALVLAALGLYGVMAFTVAPWNFVRGLRKFPACPVSPIGLVAKNTAFSSTSVLARFLRSDRAAAHLFRELNLKIGGTVRQDAAAEPPYSPSNGQDTFVAATPRADLLGMRPLLRGGRTGVRERNHPHPTSMRALRRRLARVGDPEEVERYRLNPSHPGLVA